MSSKISARVVLEGLQEPRWGMALSRQWADAGLPNRLDVAGQCAELYSCEEGQATPVSAGRLSESDLQRAAAMARGYGVVLHDRIGRGFMAGIELAQLREHVAGQTRQRFAAALMFGLPVLALHYAAPYLAGVGGPSRMVFPWLFATALSGWVCVAAGWPLLWNGILALVRLRPAGDALSALLLITAFGVSLRPLVILAMADVAPLAPIKAPIFHAVVFVLWTALIQRWLVQRAASRLGGRSSWMLHGHRRIVTAWCLLAACVVFTFGWHRAVGFGMLLPPALSFGAINRRAAGWSATLPVGGFAFVYLFGPDALGMDVEGAEIEIAAGFAALMTIVFAMGWREMTPTGEGEGRQE